MKYAIFAARVLLGFLLLYSGASKILDPQWTSAGFLAGAKTFPSLFGWFASSANIGWVDFLNAWGQTLIGLGLVVGCLTRYASFAGILLMVLYYLPALDFPTVDHGFLVDQHIIYISLFAILITANAGQYWGLDKWIFRKR